MKKLLVFVFAVVLLGSCRKNTEGCTDPNAINYNILHLVNFKPLK